MPSSPIVNALARVLGVREGMPCAEAAMRLLQAPPGVLGRGAAAVDTRGAIVYEGLEGTVTALVSVSFATSAHTGHVLCAGSHTAAVTGRYVAAYAFPVAGIIGNDAGVGKDQSGIAGLALLQASGIPAASVAALSACIGSGQSTYADGTISSCNALAQECGVRSGQSAHDACLALLRVYQGPRA